MSMGGKQTTQVSIPDYLEEAGERLVNRAEQAGRIGYVPWTGADVAAFSPMQEAAFRGTNAAASAFGMPTSSGTGMPRAQDFGGGVRGYSSFPAYQQALASIPAGQRAAIDAMFINPNGSSGQGGQGGQQPRNGNANYTPEQLRQMAAQGKGGSSLLSSARPQAGGQTRPQARPANLGQPQPQFDSLWDRINGGGPGRSFLGRR